MTQHLLQGAGIWVNKRFMYQALNNRRITDSSFRQQILYTVNQVETIYWGLVQAYEDVQAKERALEQSTKLAGDDRKQLEIGTMAPLDVVNAESTVATDKQALISSQSALNYQQQIIKQAIARNLNDPALSAAAGDSHRPREPGGDSRGEAAGGGAGAGGLSAAAGAGAGGADAAQRRDHAEGRAQCACCRRWTSTASMAAAAWAALKARIASIFHDGQSCTAIPTRPPATERHAAEMLSTALAPDKGVGFNLSIPIGNKLAQSVQARSLMEYRQAELRLEQLYTQIRMQVVNAQFALTNDRAQVQAAIAARDYNQQSLDAEMKKLHLGASTTANVLLQQRNLATAENTLIAAHAAYAKDRAGLYQILARPCSTTAST